MKSCLVALGCICSLVTFGRTLVWNGGASGDLADASWLADSETVSPADGDRLVLGTAGAFTNNSKDLSLAGIDVTVGGVSLSGTRTVTLAGDGSGLVASGAGTVDLDLPIACGPDSGEVRLDALTGVTLTLTDVLSGAAKIVVGSPGIVHFKGDNTFTGNLLVTNGTFHVWSDAAFGTTDGTTTVNVQGVKSPYANVWFHGIETSESISFNSHSQGSSEVDFAEGTTNVFHSFVFDYSRAAWRFYDRSRTEFKSGFQTTTWSATYCPGAEVIVEGSSKFYDNYMTSTMYGTQKEAVFLVKTPFRMGNSSRGGWINSRFVLRCGVADAFYFPSPTSEQWPNEPAAPTIRFNGSGVFDLNGFSQHMRDIFTSTSDGAAVSNSSPTAATLHLLQTYSTESGSSYAGRFGGKMTVSLEGPKPLTVTGTATPDVAFALTNGAALTVGSATWGGTNFVVTGGSSLTLSAAVLSEDTVIAVADGESASTVAISGTKTIAALTINGTPCKSGEWGPVGSGAANEDAHLKGEGMFVVSGGIEPVGTGKWIGQGADEKFSTVANWEGGLPASADATLTFADDGTRALLVRNFSAAGVVFDTPSTVSAFEVAADSSRPDSRLGIGTGGISVVDRQDGVARTNVISVGIGLEASSMTINVTGANDRLELCGPISSSVANTSLSRTGAGTLVLSGTNTFVGNVEISGGKVVATGGGFGAAGNAVLSRVVDNGNAVGIRFAGGTHRQNFTFERYRNVDHDVRFAAGTTNVVTGLVKMDTDRGNLRPTFEADSVTEFRGGFEATRLYDVEFFWVFRAGSRVTVAEKALLSTKPTRVAQFYAPDGATASSRSLLVFDAEDCQAPAGIGFSDGLDVRFDRDWVFKTNTLATSLQLEQNNACHPGLDLNGHPQGFGDVYDKSNAGGFGHSQQCTIKSATPAVLHVFQNKVDATNWMPDFQGGAGLEKSGTNTLLLARASSTTGTLAVTAGRLGFAGSGSWLNASAVTVAGGVLDVDKSGRLPAKGLAIRLSGGKLNLASGVRLRTKDLQVADAGGTLVPCAPGHYTAANLPDYLSGEGEIIVGGGGLMMLVR